MDCLFHLKVMDENSDSDSDDEMVDGILTSGAKADYELPSQTDLIHRAFAGDDVEAEFEKDKMEVLNEENPEPEKPVMLPGWGQWTSVQQKRGPPSWMLEEHEKAKRKREEALKMRKDSNLKHVIISEKIDKKVSRCTLSLRTTIICWIYFNHLTMAINLRPDRTGLRIFVQITLHCTTKN